MFVVNVYQFVCKVSTLFLDFVAGTVQSALLCYYVAHSIDAVEQTDFSHLNIQFQSCGVSKILSLNYVAWVLSCLL